MEKKAKMGFIEGALVIAIANIIVKIIGAVYKIPLDRFILKTDGMALYNTSYTIYNLLFVISTAGLPTAISKLVAERESKGDKAGAKKILSVALRLLFVIGLIGMFVLLFGAKYFSNFVGLSEAYLTMMAMSPSLLFVGIMSAYRGYFQGQSNMFPTAISEVIEALSKLFVGLSLSYILLPMGKMYSSAGAILGVTAGGLLGTIFLIGTYLKKKEKNIEKSSTPTKTVLKNIVKIAIPITIGVSVFTLTSFIDAAMVTRQMKGYINESPKAEISIMGNLEGDEIKDEFIDFGKLDDEKASEKKAAFTYGYLGRAITLFNMPAIVIASIATSVVPAIATANASDEKKKAKSFTSSALRISTVLALPCAIGISILAKPIFSLIYGDGSFSALLNIMGIAVAFLTLVQISNAILQSWGRVWVPVVNMLIGGAVKILVNLILVGKPMINIMGAPIGTLLCYIVVATLDIIAIIKYTGTDINIKNTFLKPVLSVLAMGVATFFSYRLFMGIGATLAMVLSIGISAIIYFAMIVMLKTLDKDDIILLPKGEKIYSLMERFRLV